MLGGMGTVPPTPLSQHVVTDTLRKRYCSCIPHSVPPCLVYTLFTPGSFLVTEEVYKNLQRDCRNYRLLEGEEDDALV